MLQLVWADVLNLAEGHGKAVLLVFHRLQARANRCSASVHCLGLVGTRVIEQHSGISSAKLGPLVDLSIKLSLYEVTNNTNNHRL